MPFWDKKQLQKFSRKDLETKTISLRTCLIINQSLESILISYNLIASPNKTIVPKRVSQCICSQRVRGSITIETACVFPLFVFFMLNIISVINIFSVYSHMEAALHQAGRKMAVHAYAAEHITDMAGIGNTALVSVALSSTYVKQELMEYLGEEYLDRSPIVDGKRGISLIQSEIMEEGDIIDLVAVYRVRPAFGIMGFGGFYVVNRCRVHAWTGYDNTAETMQTGENGEELVYITQSGTVYHRNRNCTHLRLSVHMADYEDIASMRNESGGRYYLCELCTPAAAGTVYITNQGNRYHTNPACSGLKRTVSAVPITEAGGRSPCMRCGY